MIFQLGRVLWIFFTSLTLTSLSLLSEYERAVIFWLGRLFYGGAYGVSCCLVKPGVLRSYHLTILVSVLEGGDISAGSDTVDLLHLCNFDFLVFFFQEYERAVIFRLDRLLSGGAQSAEVSQLLPLCSGIQEGGDILAGSAILWWSTWGQLQSGEAWGPEVFASVYHCLGWVGYSGSSSSL